VDRRRISPYPLINVINANGARFGMLSVSCGFAAYTAVGRLPSDKLSRDAELGESVQSPIPEPGP
jgi:hypothetical protein